MIYGHKIKENSLEWEEIEVSFKPKSDIYDEFMFGASQVTGTVNFLAIDYIYIVESWELKSRGGMSGWNRLT